MGSSRLFPLGRACAEYCRIHFCMTLALIDEVKKSKEKKMGTGARLLKLALLGIASSLFFGKQALIFAAAAVGIAIARMLYLNATSKPNPPKSTPVPAGKTRICVVGYTHSGPTAKAHYLADKIARKYPDKYESWYYFDQFALWTYLKEKFDAVPFPQHLKGHATSPFCWFESGASNTIVPVGGSDHLSEWALKNFTDADIVQLAKTNPLSPVPYLTGTAFHCDEGKPIPPATAAA